MTMPFASPADSGLVVPVSRPKACMRLLCLPSAGAGAASYFRWARMLPEDVEMAVVRLPGRESRLQERPLDRIDLIVDLATAALQPMTDLPYALFGYSMGSLVAHEVLGRFLSLGVRAPLQLVAASFRAPHLPYRFTPIRGLSDEAFLDELARYEGLPDEIRQCPDTLALMLPALRADFESMENYRHGPLSPRNIPVLVAGGAMDRTVMHEELMAWHLHTTAGFDLVEFSGGHFFAKDHAPMLLELIVSKMRQRAVEIATKVSA